MHLRIYQWIDISKWVSAFSFPRQEGLYLRTETMRHFGVRVRGGLGRQVCSERARAEENFSTLPLKRFIPPINFLQRDPENHGASSDHPGRLAFTPPVQCGLLSDERCAVIII